MPSASGDPNNEAVDEAAPASRKRRGSFVNSWNSHVSREISAGRSLKSCSASYAALTPEEKVGAQDSASAANDVQGDGNRPFGPRKRERERQQIDNEAQLFLRLNPDLSSQMNVCDAPALVVNTRAALGDTTITDVLRVVRRAETIVRKKKDSQQAACIQPIPSSTQ